MPGPETNRRESQGAVQEVAAERSVELSAEQLAVEAVQEQEAKAVLQTLEEKISRQDHAVAADLRAELKTQIDAGGEINIKNMKNMDMGPGAEEEPKIFSEAEQLAQWLKDHPETVVNPADLRESGPGITEFDGLIAAFEAEHSLEELNQIIDLTPEEAPNHPVRQPAKLALIPINTKLNALKKETNISSQNYEELRAKYKRLSKAVGIINNNKVDHTR